MNLNLKKSDLIYRKLNISDYQEFQKLFYSCFKKKISYEFFKWRYFTNKHCFCYGVFKKKKLVANVGMILMKLNNNKFERIYSRHSSMVLKKYRGLGIFSNLLSEVKKKILKNVQIIAMWPNKNNFSNFGIVKKKIINKKYFIYKTFSISNSLKKTKNFNIKNLKILKNFIICKNSLFLKNFIYFKNRYLLYRNQDYYINEFKLKQLSSFFILKINKDDSGLNYVILDHFGSEKIKSKHISNLINNQNKLIFLSKKKLKKSKFILLNSVNLKIGFINNLNLKEKKNLANKEVFLGDTDIFITTGKV